MSYNTELQIDFGELTAIQFPTTLEFERYLYYCLINVDEHYDVLPRAYEYLETAINRIVSVGEAPNDAKLILNSTVDMSQSFWSKIDELVPSNGLSDVQRLYWWRQLAPMGLVDGCLLQNGSIAATSDSPISAELLGLYTHELGASNPADNHANLYRDLLHEKGIYLPGSSTWAFVQDPELLDDAFSLPVLTLSLAQFTRRFLPE